VFDFGTNLWVGLQAGNILLDGLGAVKIADFGVSEQLSDAVSKSDTRIGTPLWMVRSTTTATT
jgi:serine/threonine protein kinase